MKNSTFPIRMSALLIFCMSMSFGALAQFKTEEVPMMRGVTKNIKNGWTTSALLTVGETNNDNDDVNLDNLNYKFPGIPDGIGAFQSGNRVTVYVNSEIGEAVGYPYSLSNGTTFLGSRISKLELSRISRKILSAGLAYNKIFDRYGQIVITQSQINEGGSANLMAGFQRFCSGYAVKKNYHGFVRDIYFAGEETSGGQLVALDVATNVLHVVPMAGRAAFENVTSIENYGSNKVAFLIGDDRGPAPLYLYVGEKGSSAPGQYSPLTTFLKNNGLANGHLYVWVSDSIISGVNERELTTFNGTGSLRNGKFVKIEHYKPAFANSPGYDIVGFAAQSTQEASAEAAGYFRFSRPEDLATNPNDGTQLVMASTGLSSLNGGVDSWGDVYVIDFQDSTLQAQLALPLDSINNLPATVKIIYDGDDSGGGAVTGPDFGIRSPDNVAWAGNGKVYINEDAAVTGFGVTSQIEASMWQIDPVTGAFERCLEMDRNAVPFKQTDPSPTVIGNWESSGVLDVTNLFVPKPGELILLTDVQAHGVSSTVIGGTTNLAEGGQLLLASKIFPAENFSGSAVQPQLLQKPATTPITISAFPNPADSEFTLSKTADIQLFDQNGKLVLTQKNANKVNVSNLIPGIYSLKTDQNEVIQIVVQ